MMFLNRLIKPFILPVVFFAFILQPRPMAETINSTCPVLDGEKVDESIFTDYQGKRVYFCCNKCRREFISVPKKYINNLPQFALNDSLLNSNNINQGQKEHNADRRGNDHTKNRGRKFDLIAYAGKFHPLATHFPIALVMTSFLFSLLSLIRKNPGYEQISVNIIYLAGLSAIVTALLGLAAGASATFPAGMKEYFVWHRRLGISSGIMTLLTSYFAHRYKQKMTSSDHFLYRLILFITTVLVAITGHLGATLVYGPEHFEL